MKKDDFYRLLIKRMPKKLKYLTAIDLIACVTKGESIHVPELKAMDAIKKYELDNLTEDIRMNKGNIAGEMGLN